MKNYREILKQGRFFLVPYLFLLIVSIVILIEFSKADIHIWLNQHWSHLGDISFPIITFFGNGIFAIILTILLLFYRVGYSIVIFATYAISGIMAQLIKNLLFPHMLRPLPYLDGFYNLHLVKGVEMLAHKSFPSGHATTAFAMMLCFAFFTKNKLLQVLFFILAIVIAYSRVYLSQHFLVDITGGSVIGVLTTIIYYNYHTGFKAEWLDKSIISVFKK